MNWAYQQRALVWIGLCVSGAMGQSDPTLFETVISLPEDQAVLSIDIDFDTQVNLSQGGVVDGSVFAVAKNTSGNNVEFNMDGGRAIGVTFFTGSSVNLHGGRFEGETVFLQTNLHWYGKHMLFRRFYRDWRDNHYFQVSGVFGDGNVFIFDQLLGDEISELVGYAHTVEPPSVAAVVVLSSGEAPRAGIRPGQSITVRGEAVVPREYRALGASLTMEGGSIEPGFRALDTEFHQRGGVVADSMYFGMGSEVTLSGGETLGDLRLTGDSSLTIQDGANIEGEITAEGSRIFITGGVVESPIVSKGSIIEMTGGAVRSRFELLGEGSLRIEGGDPPGSFVFDRGNPTTTLLQSLVFVGSEFQLNGEPVDAFPDPLEYYDRFTYTTPTGHIAILDYNGLRGFGNYYARVLIEQAPMDPPDLATVQLNEGVGPVGLRPGQSLRLSGTGELGPYFDAVDSTIEVAGGVIRENAYLVNTDLMMTGGHLMAGARIMEANVRFGPGAVVDGIEIGDGSVVEIHGESFGALDIRNSEATIAPGSRIDKLNTYYSTVTIADSDIDDLDTNYGDITIAQCDVKTAFFNSGTVDLKGVQIEGSLNQRYAEVTVRDTTIFGSVNTYGFNHVEIFSGRVEGYVWAHHAADVIIRGGEYLGKFYSFNGGALYIHGSGAEIDGELLEGLEIGVPHRVLEMDVMLSLTLESGEPFEVMIERVGSGLTPDGNYIAEIYVVPTEPPCGPDVNGDGVLDLGDLTAFVGLFLSHDLAADVNGDGILDLGDVSTFIATFLAGC